MWLASWIGLVNHSEEVSVFIHWLERELRWLLQMRCPVLTWGRMCSAQLKCASVVYIPTVQWTNLNSSLTVSVILTHKCSAALAVVLTLMVLQTVSPSPAQLFCIPVCSITPCCTLTWDVCSLTLLKTIRKSHSSIFFHLVFIHPGHQTICLGLCRTKNKDDQRSRVLRKCFTAGYLFPWFNIEFTIHYIFKVLHVVLPFLC